MIDEVSVKIRFEGDKSKNPVHYMVFLHYRPTDEELLINWDTKEVKIQNI